MCEIWKKIEGYENYQVSNLGRVRSLNYHRTGKTKILKPAKNNRGYLLVNLCKNGKRKMYLVHRLVAQAFIPNPDNLPEINHKNEEDKTDNRVECLEYCDSKYNSNYGTRTQRSVEKRSKPILQFSLEGEFVKEWASASEVQRQMGYKSQSISRCCLGEKHYKTAYGYIWKFKEKAA